VPPPNTPKYPAPARTNRTRDQSMVLLQDATISLLLENHPEALTVREIAEVAGVHYRYIPDYFGGKAELFASIYSRVAQEAADQLQFPFAAALTDGVDRRIIRLARLALWLSSNHPDGVPISDQPMRHQLEQILVGQFGIDPDSAVLVAERLMALVIVLAAHPDVVNPSGINVQAHINLELQMLAALAKN
jgi:AcrR family transcriptional regulator